MAQQKGTTSILETIRNKMKKIDKHNLNTTKEVGSDNDFEYIDSSSKSIIDAKTNIQYNNINQNSTNVNDDDFDFLNVENNQEETLDIPINQKDNLDDLDENKQEDSDIVEENEEGRDDLDDLDEEDEEILTSTQQEQNQQMGSNMKSNGLLSEGNINRARNSIKELINTIPKPQQFLSSQSAAFRSGETIEDMVAGILEPKLDQWLNENLPMIVERVVKEEIKKLIPKD